jgi:signal transduction histidine kinase
LIWRATTFRFAALVFLLQILAAAILLFGLGAVLRSQSRADAISVAEALRDDLIELRAEGGPHALSNAIGQRIANPADRSAVLALTSPDGKVIAGNVSDLHARLPVNGPYTLRRLRRNGRVLPEAMFVQTTRLRGGELLLTGIVVENERKLFAQLERATLITLCLSILFAAFAAFVSTRIILNRLHATVKTLESVREGDLSRRVPHDATRDAFAVLGEEVNRALDRVARLNAELKLATDGLAHDLKSPLTRMRAALDRLARQANEPEVQAAIEIALDENNRLMSMIETALNITRAEAGLGRESFVTTDLRDMLETIVEIYAPLVEDEGRTITLNAPETVMLPIHRQLMDQALGNLVDNAIKYGAGAIGIALTVGETSDVITITDEGPGIAPEKRDEALRRYSRLDEARGGPGAGLGLSLVQAVAHLHDGTLTMGDANPGLEVRIELPRPH